MPPRWISALVAGENGEIFELDGYGAVGMAGDALQPLSVRHTRPVPRGGELMFLPDRVPILFNLETRRFEKLPRNPYAPDEAIFPVAVFNSPGYINTLLCGYQETPAAGPLPLFSYGAVGWHKGAFRSAVILVDREKRQDLDRMPRDKVIAGIKRMRRQLPENRLRKHLENCALDYGCPAGKNFFLGRYEAPLPTSRKCNARCLGCLSLQEDTGIPCSQQRISFTPSPREIAEVALAHIQRVAQPVVSFGQGCEGDPLLAADVIEPAVRLIREKTDKGTINLNTNGGLPKQLRRLVDAGLDSIRISINSVREACYTAYFRPRRFRFADVLESIDIAHDGGCFVSINYLNMPGFTDTPEEYDALRAFLNQRPVRMIQWRNLNFDPVRYHRAMAQAASPGTGMGMASLLKRIRREFPRLKFGYFNPPKEKFDFIDI